MTPASTTETEARIKEIERKYPRRFLERSLHSDAIDWRLLTAPNAEPARDFYVTVIRGKRTGWLVGPLPTHEAALARVEAARTEACRIDPWCDFDAFGTSSLPRGTGPTGKLNGKILC
ncbi:MAG: hypothetical protein HXX10_07550 [Rhodoplanes sp.]|uniref:hypothetical protein n=1 Tax=Rhodoplanes sp. TaxID=1968906 RepID=UPI001826814F|nr:hypothetical protein [Rhodoplanes sp.]NVO13875.1 hypothetical protein [Rhodoplanes sp.]